MFSATCDECGVVLVVPMFDRDWHKGYQRLGPKRLGTRADVLLDQVLAEVASLSGADATRIHLFGFSAGAQFAHRYAMAHPHRVARAVVAAAGWYTFPDQQQRFPYGIRPVKWLHDVAFNPKEFLRVPITVLIGCLDTSTENMRNTARTLAQQGATRLDRARNWVAAMRAAAASVGVEPQLTLIEVPGIGHSFTGFGERGELVELVRHALFDDVAIDARRDVGCDVSVTTSGAPVPAIT
jgi:pimeloyl-ACP methyl ester carboxylesterase